MNLYLNMTKLRTGNHKFPRECGRWLGIDLSQRKCTLCNLHEIGDEFHYVLKCPFFSEERKKIDRQYFFNPNILKYKELMNSKDETKLKNFSIFAKILINTVQ